jgi:hypothetical protein
MSSQTFQEANIARIEEKVAMWRRYLDSWEEAQRNCKKREEEAHVDLAMFEKVEREETEPVQKLAFQEIVSQYRGIVAKEERFLVMTNNVIRNFTVKLLDSLAELANAMNQARSTPSPQ